MAWYNATRLLDPASKAAAEASIDRSPGEFIREIMRQPLLRLFRLLVHSMRRWPAARTAQGVQTR
jgi:hypothetical protein